MSQIIAGKTGQGIFLASDSLALDFDPQGQFHETKVKRLIPLSPNTAILAGGAAASANMAQALREFIAEEQLDLIEDVYGAALPFLATEYERYMRKQCEILPLDPIHHVHFILAGRSKKGSDHPYRLLLIWTKKQLPQLDGDEITSVFAVPRSFRLELKLNRLCQENTPLEQILPAVKSSLEELAQKQDEIEGPFSFAFLTEKGFQELS